MESRERIRALGVFSPASFDSQTWPSTCKLSLILASLRHRPPRPPRRRRSLPLSSREYTPSRPPVIARELETCHPSHDDLHQKMYTIGIRWALGTSVVVVVIVVVNTTARPSLVELG